MHPLTLEAFIGTCSKPKSFVVDFATSIGMQCFKPSFVALDIQIKMFAPILFLASNNVLACRNLGGCILAPDGNQDFFDEVLHPFLSRQRILG